MTQMDLLERIEEPRHVAGSRMFPLQPDVIGDATFGGPLDCYRYLLIRRWVEWGRFVLFIMMNPSTARTDRDDTTIAKVTRIVRGWNSAGKFSPFSGFAVTNVYAYRCTDQRRLAEIADPIGPENDDTVDRLSALADMVIFAYGRPKLPQFRARGLTVARRLVGSGVTPHVLRLSADGTPWHPLLLPDATDPFPWSLPS